MSGPTDDKTYNANNTLSLDILFARWKLAPPPRRINASDYTRSSSVERDLDFGGDEAEDGAQLILH